MGEAQGERNAVGTCVLIAALLGCGAPAQSTVDAGRVGASDAGNLDGGNLGPDAGTLDGQGVFPPDANVDGDATVSNDALVWAERLNEPAFHSYFYAPKIVEEVAAQGVHTFHIDTAFFGDPSLSRGACSNAIYEDGSPAGDGAVGPGRWSFETLLCRIRTVQQADPQARFVIRAAVGSPRWWNRLVPGDLERYADGCEFIGTSRNAQGRCVDSLGRAASFDDPAALHLTHVHLESEVLWEHIELGMRRMRATLEAEGLLDAVEAFILTGLSSQEWLLFDAGFTFANSVRPMSYGELHARSYHGWHAQAYGVGATVPDESHFDQLYHPSVASSAFVVLPRDLNIVRYQTYRSQLVASAIVRAASLVKRVFDGAPVGAIYGYMNEMGGNPGHAHNGLGTILRSSSVDFINPMPSYHDRAYLGADFARHPVTSVAVNGKFSFTDYDHGTSASMSNYLWLCEQYRQAALNSSDAGRAAELNEVWRTQCDSGDPQSQFLNAMSGLGFRMSAAGDELFPPTLPEDISNLRRFLGYSIFRDVRFSYLSLHNTTEGGNENSYLSHPELLAEVERLRRWKSASHSHSRDSIAEILVVSDEASTSYLRPGPVIVENYADRRDDRAGLGSHSLATPRISLARMGAPYDHVLLSDLDALDVSRYKLIIFLNLWSASAAQRELISSRLKNENRTLVFHHAAGMFQNDTQSLSFASELVGINLVDLGGTQAPEIRVADSSPVFQGAHSLTPRFVDGCCDNIVAADPAASTLGVNSGGYTTLAMRNFDRWHSVWAATLHLTPAMWRDLARYAGVHVYADHDETLYVNRSFLTLVPTSSGTRNLRFSQPVNVRDFLSDESLANRVMHVPLEVQQGEVRILRYELTEP